MVVVVVGVVEVVAALNILDIGASWSANQRATPLHLFIRLVARCTVVV